MERELLTTREACGFLQLGRTKLFALARAGQIRRTKIGRATRWKVRELERFVDRCTRK